MKYVIFSIIIIALLQFSCSKDDDVVLNPNGTINGQIKTLSESEYASEKVNGEVEKASLIEKTVSEYDVEGKILNRKRYGSNNLLRYSWIFNYNNLGQNTQEEFYADNQLSYTIEYSYDAIGNLIRESYYGFNGYNTIIKYIYDGNGNLIEEQNYDFRGNFASKFTYNHDSNGNVIEEKYFNPVDFLSWRKTSKYDNKGKLIEANGYQTDGKLTSIVTFNYDVRGNLTEEKLHNYPFTGIFDITSYTYDKIDKMINWLQRVKFFNDEPIAITEREIEYYF